MKKINVFIKYIGEKINNNYYKILLCSIILLLLLTSLLFKNNDLLKKNIEQTEIDYEEFYISSSDNDKTSENNTEISSNESTNSIIEKNDNTLTKEENYNTDKELVSSTNTSNNTTSKDNTSNTTTSQDTTSNTTTSKDNTSNNTTSKDTTSNTTTSKNTTSNTTTSKDTTSNTTTSKNTTSNTTTSKDTTSNTTTSKDTTSNNIKDDTIKKENNSLKEEKTNGWKLENGYYYYYLDGIKQKNTYIDYYYLDSNGKRIDKIGDFSATIYGATAWTNQKVNIRAKATQYSTKIGTIPTGAKLTILSDDDSKTKYIKIKYNNTTGYVYSNFLLINLPDIIPDMYYEITNANKSIYRTSGYAINGITGTNLYGFTKEYNQKIDKETYYAPLLYPVAKQLQKAYDIAKSQNYNLKVYDSYRPYQITTKLYNNLYSLYKTNNVVKQKINYDSNGNYWGPNWFLAKNYSSHNRGIALDIALTDAKGNDLVAQSAMHTLDTSSIVSNNNNVSNKLKEIMVTAGFETLKSEWWHFEENDYKSSPVNDFLLA